MAGFWSRITGASKIKETGEQKDMRARQLAVAQQATRTANNGFAETYHAADLAKQSAATGVGAADEMYNKDRYSVNTRDGRLAAKSVTQDNTINTASANQALNNALGQQASYAQANYNYKPTTIQNPTAQAASVNTPQNMNAAGLNAASVGAYGDIAGAQISPDSINRLTAAQGANQNINAGNQIFFRQGEVRDVQAPRLGRAGVQGNAILQTQDALNARQNALLNSLQAQASGAAPSIAELQLKQAQQSNLAQQLALAGSARGRMNAGALQRGLANNLAAANQQATATGITARLAEQQQAQQAYNQAVQAAVTTDTQRADLQARLEQENLANSYQAQQARDLRRAELGLQTQQLNQASDLERFRIRSDLDKTQFQADQARQIRQAELDQELSLQNAQLQQAAGLANQDVSRQVALENARLAQDTSKTQYDAALRVALQNADYQQAARLQNAQFQQEGLRLNYDASLRAALQNAEYQQAANLANQSMSLEQARLFQGDKNQQAQLALQNAQFQQEAMARQYDAQQAAYGRMSENEMALQQALQNQWQFNAQQQQAANLANAATYADLGKYNAGLLAQQEQSLGAQRMAALNAATNVDLSNLAAYQNQRALAVNASMGEAGVLGQQWNNLAGLQQTRAQVYGQGTAALMGLTGGALIAGGTAYAKGSDERIKENVKPGEKDLKNFYDALTASTYNYKDEKYGKGTFTSVMAQDLEKTPIGKSMVQENSDGVKMVDYGRGLATMLAGQSYLHQRLNAIESALKKK